MKIEYQITKMLDNHFGSFEKETRTGEKLELDPDLSLAIEKRDFNFAVTETSTGLLFASGKLKREAIQEARKILLSMGIDKVKELIEEKKQYLKSKVVK